MDDNTNNGALKTPRPSLPFNWQNETPFNDFDEYERQYAFQVVQNLDALPKEKAKILFNFLDVNKNITL